MRLPIPSTRSKGKGAPAPNGIENIKKGHCLWLSNLRQAQPLSHPPPPTPPPLTLTPLSAQHHTGIQRYLDTSTPSSCSTGSSTAYQPVSKRIRQSATIAPSRSRPPAGTFESQWPVAHFALLRSPRSILNDIGRKKTRGVLRAMGICVMCMGCRGRWCQCVAMYCQPGDRLVRGQSQSRQLGSGHDLWGRCIASPRLGSGNDLRRWSLASASLVPEWSIRQGIASPRVGSGDQARHCSSPRVWDYAVASWKPFNSSPAPIAAIK
jgi:hypothetical protein